MFVFQFFRTTKTQGQEVKFHEIEIGDRMIFRSWDQTILPVFKRSKLQFFMSLNFWSLDQMANSYQNLT